jgi:hypothetical protein
MGDSLVPPTTEQLTKQLELLKKQKEVLDAEKALMDARKAIADANKPPAAPSAQATELAAAKAATELATAQKALADARKAQSEADLAAAKAAIGEVPSSGITGTVDLKDGAGDLEAALLAMVAVREAADIIGNRIREVLRMPAAIVMVSAAETPTFGNAIAYDAEVTLVDRLFEKAIVSAEARSAMPEPAPAPVPVPAPAPTPEAKGIPELMVAEAFPALATAGLALEATTRLLSFFRSDVVVKGTPVTLEDAAAVNAIACALHHPLTGAATGSNGAKAFDVSMPGVYHPAMAAAATTFFVTDVTALSGRRGEALKLQTTIEAEMATLQTQIAAAEIDAAKKGGAEQRAATKALGERTDLAAGLKSAMAFMDAWLTKLGTPDSKGVAALVNVAKEKALATAIKAGYLLIVKVTKAGGGVMTKKHLWTFLGRLPLFHMGGAAVSFTLLHGATGNVAASGIIPVHGGFVKADQLRPMLKELK